MPEKDCKYYINQTDRKFFRITMTIEADSHNKYAW